MEEKLKYCYGCRDNFYNGGNPYGVKRCWHLDDAKIVKKIMIHRDQPPPYKNRKPVKTLSCWYGDSGMRAVDPTSIAKDGYWKF